MSKYLRDEQEEVKDFSSRYKLLYSIVIIAVAVIFSRLWYLQIISGNELRSYSEKNRIKETKLPAPRGLVLDREGSILVENLPGFEATIVPQYATKLEQTAQSIGEILKLPPKEVIAMVKESRRQNGPFFPVKIKENLNLDEVYLLKRLRFDHPGLRINEAILRHYPLNENGSQIFGYVGEISPKQIQDYNKKFRAEFRFEQGDIIGKNGLEEVWEGEIRGKDGISFVEVDARGREAQTETPSFLGLRSQDKVPGNNLVLTIDRDIQEAAFKAMKREDHIGPRIGGLVAMKSNGEILAWVNQPSYNPNEFSTGISSELWSKLINDPFKPLRNKVIQDHYSPGSTFKPIVALAALQENVIAADTEIYSPGAIRFGRRTYHDYTRAGHGNVTVIDAIERSSNIFFYKMGIALGIDNIAKYARLLGIGSRTEINLRNEVPGLMPTSEWKKRTQGEVWQPGENLINAIGQGFVLATTLQMAVAFNTIGLEGQMYKPFLVKRLINNDNEVVKEFQPQLVRDISKPSDNGYIEKRHFATVKEGMRRVANGSRGTARWYKVPGIEMAGKTGTSQVMSFSADQIYGDCDERPIEQRHHGWFVAFAPADKPEITVAVLTEHSCSGSAGGAPVARDVVKAYVEKYHPEWMKPKKIQTLSNQTLSDLTSGQTPSDGNALKSDQVPPIQDGDIE